jgi:soluble cytochrome b562
MTLFENEPAYWQPQQKPARRRPAAGLVSTILVLVLAAASVLAVANKQYIIDQFTVWNFASSPALDSYIDRSTMTDHGAFLFKASQPSIEGAEQFNQVCSTHEEGTGVLGCYTPSTKLITLFDVTDDQLDGLEDVVAAHEMLHAAWDRLSKEAKAALTPQLEAEATKLSGDKEFADTMAFYARAEPGQRLNELHSIIGTEVAGLSPELESYYAQYFTDRAALVGLHEKSNAVFVKLQQQTADLVSEIDALREQIDADYADYNSGYDQLNNDIDAFNAKANDGSFDTQEQFDQERSALIYRQQRLDDLYSSIERRNKNYNDKVDELEKLNAQAAALNTAINVVPRSDSGVG